MVYTRLLSSGGLGGLFPKGRSKVARSPVCLLVCFACVHGWVGSIKSFSFSAGLFSACIHITHTHTYTYTDYPRALIFESFFFCFSFSASSMGVGRGEFVRFDLRGSGNQTRMCVRACRKETSRRVVFLGRCAGERRGWGREVYMLCLRGRDGYCIVRPRERESLKCIIRDEM